MPNFEENFSSKDAPKGETGPFRAKVIGYLDGTYSGNLRVEVLTEGGTTGASGQQYTAKYLSPFFGTTGIQYTSPDPNDYNNTQKSYGFWAVPPDIGSQVLIMLVGGNAKYCYWIGCVVEDNMNFMTPGLAATESTVDTTLPKDSQGRNARVPTGEYNKKVPANNSPNDPEKLKKPTHPFATVLTNQGLAYDDIRGITTSSSRRELPSSVFGISTPGPLDKQAGAKQGPIGTIENQIPNAYVSRLGGTTFVMDDGDPNFLRKKPAGQGEPDYAAIEQGDKSGDVTIPHNELVRIRTRTGHQILLHNSEDLIYIGNAKGTTWIELTSNGKIDIYAADSVSVHTKADMNFYADRDINMEAGRNVNIKAAGTTAGTLSGEVRIESKDQLQLIVGTNGFITTGKQLEINSGTDTFLTTGTTFTRKVGTAYYDTILGDTHTWRGSGTDYSQSSAPPRTGAIDNSPATSAKTASSLSTFSNIYNSSGSSITSIMKRIPNVEPWTQHENLDPLALTAAKTDRESSAIKFTNGSATVPKFYKSYTTITDTFLKVPPADSQPKNQGAPS